MTKQGEYGEMCDCWHYAGEHFAEGPCGGEQIPQPSTGPAACPCRGYR